jgi:hypothetical protein
MYIFRNRSHSLAWIALGFICSLGSNAFGANANHVTVKTILTGLKNPRGVAVRPDGSGEAYEVFVAESGAGRVVKISGDKPEKPIDVIAGIASKPAIDDNSASIGIQSICFLDHMRLVVAGGEDGAPFARLYELPEPASPLSSDQHKAEANMPETGKEPGFDPHIFRSIARTQPNDRVGDYLLIAAPTDHETAGLVYIPVRSGTLGDAVPARLKNTGNELQIDGIAVGNNGYVVVASISPADSGQSSKLAFFSPLDRRIVMQIPTELPRIVALAYSPKSGNLYAANSLSADDRSAGIYRIDASGKPNAPSCAVVKVADVRRPTALSFAPDGALYVTSIGDSKSYEAGVLLKLAGDL